MQTYRRPEMATQIDKIRAEIEERGESFVGCEELTLLCVGISDSEKAVGISHIAAWERWAFEYRPDGTVRFTNL